MRRHAATRQPTGDRRRSLGHPPTLSAPVVLATARAEALHRPFRAVIFDWDGTAVADRREDAGALGGLLGELDRLGVWVAVVTGTNVGNIDRQIAPHLPPARRRHLVLCTNRGSEVYSYHRDGALVRRWRRRATLGEEQALTAIAEAVRDAIAARTGLDIRIVYDRLNRRKMDLIPVPEWADPPKARIGALLIAVETRLRGAGLTGGLAEAVQLARDLARTHGLPDARITSDVKHIEVGLTDKGDALVWLQERLLRPRGIALADVLIGGDEFGPIAGFAGSDDRLHAQAGEATVVSVGSEPNGVPTGVLHLGGGPVRFRALLADQVWRHRLVRPSRRQRGAGPAGGDTEDWLEAELLPAADPNWRLQEREFRPALEHEVESRFAIGNGLLGVRGSIGQPLVVSRPRTYVAGLFDRRPGPHPLPALVPGPDWLRLRLIIDGTPLTISPAHAPAHPRVLDVRRGVLLSTWFLRDAAGRAGRVRTLRFASLADRQIAVQVVQFEVDRPIWLELEAWLEPPDNGLVLERASSDLTVWRTPHAERRLAVAMEAALAADGGASLPVAGEEASRRRWGWVATPDRHAIFTRVVAMARDAPAGDAGDGATRALAGARRARVRRLLDAHVRAWAERWAAGDVAVEGDEEAQDALRFAVYHLVSAANPEDEHVSIGARALTGDAYLGHVFWDTEIFLLPFYIFTWPAAARALLMYRYHTLPAARAKAARLGLRGALYAWESADTGEEATPPHVIGPDGAVIAIRCGEQEQHISADVAYAVWQYWQATADAAFLLDAGAEILLETARFWASRAMREADGRYHIRGVIGPDEYHEGVDDNAYTNGMATWNIERGLEVAALLVKRWPDRWVALRVRLALTEDELDRWRDVTHGLVTGFDADTGLFEQFAGYFALEPVDLDAYEPRAVPVDVLLGPERTRALQVIKQADVLMLLALLWDCFPEAVRQANFYYYEPRCGHGSSLSPAIHALVAARLGDLDLAERYFHQAAAIDLDDTMSSAAGGVHIAALGGLWQAAVLGFAGLALRPDGLRFDPHLPETWQAVRFSVQWRGRCVRVALQRAPLTFTATLTRGRPLTVELAGIRHSLHASRPWCCRWDRYARRWQEVP